MGCNNKMVRTQYASNSLISSSPSHHGTAGLEDLTCDAAAISIKEIIDYLGLVEFKNDNPGFRDGYYAMVGEILPTHFKRVFPRRDVISVGEYARDIPNMRRVLVGTNLAYIEEYSKYGELEPGEGFLAWALPYEIVKKLFSGNVYNKLCEISSDGFIYQ